VQQGGTPLFGGRNVQHDQFVGAFPVVAGRELHRIARVPEPLKPHSLDDPTVLHVQTRDDALCPHDSRAPFPWASPRASASPLPWPPTAATASLRSTSPVYRARPTMTPCTPRSSKAARAMMSSRDETPPDAMTGIPAAAATSSSTATLGPVRAPSRLISVTVRAATPSSAISRARSVARRDVSCTQPRTAT